MADEITINVTIDIKKGNFKSSFRPGTITPDFAGTYVTEQVQNINTSTYEAIGTGDATSGGYSFFYNISTAATTTPTINIAQATGAATSYVFAKLLPGEYATFRNNNVAMAVLAVGATAALHYGVFDP